MHAASLNLGNPLVWMDDFGMNRYLYLAGLWPTNPRVQEGTIVKSKLFCHHDRFDDRCFPTKEVRGCSCSYGVLLKAYNDWRVTFEQFHIVFWLSWMILSKLMKCFQRLLPPPSKSSSDEVPTPLTWRGTVWFFINYSISLSADEVSFQWLLDVHSFGANQSFLHATNLMFTSFLGCSRMMQAHWACRLLWLHMTRLSTQAHGAKIHQFIKLMLLNHKLMRTENRHP